MSWSTCHDTDGMFLGILVCAIGICTHRSWCSLPISGPSWTEHVTTLVGLYCFPSAFCFTAQAFCSHSMLYTKPF
jgi:hypothetical protein